LFILPFALAKLAKQEGKYGPEDHQRAQNDVAQHDGQKILEECHFHQNNRPTQQI
jgi:hypothetical protein